MTVRELITYVVLMCIGVGGMILILATAPRCQDDVHSLWLGGVLLAGCP